jgi:hypothetical protein
LNLWPLPPQGSALSTELLGHELVRCLEMAGRAGFEPAKDVYFTLTHLAGGRTQPGYATSPYTLTGGGRGIRTPGDVAATMVFKTIAISLSAIPPRGLYLTPADGSIAWQPGAVKQNACRSGAIAGDGIPLVYFDPSYSFTTSHVGHQHLRYGNRPVLLLVRLEN